MPLTDKSGHFGHQLLFQSGGNSKCKIAPTLELKMTLACGAKTGYRPVTIHHARKTDYLAAQTVISTIVPGVSTAPTAVRVGKFPRSTQAIQASFIASLSAASCM